jgi:hypothetical protein
MDSVFNIQITFSWPKESSHELSQQIVKSTYETYSEQLNHF